MGDRDFSVLPLGNPSDYSDDERLKGAQLRIGEDGRGELASDEPQKPSIQHASLSGPSPTFVSPRGMQGTSQDSEPQRAPVQAPVQRAMTPQELMDHANRMLDSQTAQHHALMAAGPATGQRDDAGGKIPDWLVNEMKRNGGR